MKWVCILSKYTLKLIPFATVLNCAHRGEAGEGGDSVCGSSWGWGLTERGQNQGLPGYFQPWRALLSAGTDGNLGMTPALVSWKQVTSRGAGGQAPWRWAATRGLASSECGDLSSLVTHTWASFCLFLRRQRVMLWQRENKLLFIFLRRLCSYVKELIQILSASGCVSLTRKPLTFS